MAGTAGRGKFRFIFDVGGVLIGHDDALLCRRIAARCDCPERAQPALSCALHDPLLGTGLRSMREVYQQLVAELGFRGDFPEFLELWSSHFHEMTEMIPVLDRLSRDYRIVLFSNTNEGHWSYLMRQNFAVLRYARATYLSYELGLLKPDAASFRSVLEREGYAPGQCFFVDDRAENVAAAQAAGMIAHAFSGASRFEAALSSYGI